MSDAGHLLQVLDSQGRLSRIRNVFRRDRRPVPTFAVEEADEGDDPSRSAPGPRPSSLPAQDQAETDPEGYAVLRMLSDETADEIESLVSATEFPSRGELEKTLGVPLNGLWVESMTDDGDLETVEDVPPGLEYGTVDPILQVHRAPGGGEEDQSSGVTTTSLEGWVDLQGSVAYIPLDQYDRVFGQDEEPEADVGGLDDRPGDPSTITPSTPVTMGGADGMAGPQPAGPVESLTYHHLVRSLTALTAMHEDGEDLDRIRSAVREVDRLWGRLRQTVLRAR